MPGRRTGAATAVCRGGSCPCEPLFSNGAISCGSSLSFAGLGIPGIAAAQAPQTTRIRADINSVDADTLHLAARNGEKMTVRLTPDATVVAIVPIALADIKPGSFIGSAALPQPDGKLRALEVHVFPESMRVPAKVTAPSTCGLRAQ